MRTLRLMNIFVLHSHPRKAARYHVDVHVRKMVLETCQLLYTAHWILWYPKLNTVHSAVKFSRAQKRRDPPPYFNDAPTNKTTGEVGYRPCHPQHPCALWARESIHNYHWLARLGVELAREYRFRFGGKPHACEVHAEWLLAHPPPAFKCRVPKPLMDYEFAIAMDEEYKISSLPIVCYRHYYRTSKNERGLIKYTRRYMPHWLVMWVE